MSDDVTSEEFRRFILENREMIEKILQSEDGGTSKKDKLVEYRDKAEKGFKEANRTLLDIINDEDVQKHFMAGCLEFMDCIGAIVKAMPLTETGKEVVEDVKKTKDNVVKNGASTVAKKKMSEIKVEVPPEEKPKRTKKTKIVVEDKS